MANKTNMKCGNCFYLEDDGLCHRFPQQVKKETTDWCGEWYPADPKSFVAEDLNVTQANLSQMSERLQ